MVLFRMNMIWRNYVCHLRQGKVPHRCQSGAHPVAPLGSRILTDPAKVFEHNMWDHMQWSQEEEAAARKKVEENSTTRVAPEEQAKFESDANKYWDAFYQTHKNKFFKNRNWLLREFPEILPVDQNAKEKVEESSWDQIRIIFSRMQGTETHCGKSCVSSAPGNKGRPNFPNPDLEEHSDDGPGKTGRFPGSNATFRILEVGCGAGNSVFPILNTLQNFPGSFLYCCDFASEAVQLVKSHASYTEARCSAFVHDVCDDGLAYPFPDGVLDAILLVFVLSSVHPGRMQAVVHRLSRLLKPGGMLLFRDHGRYDNAQLRFKKGRCLSENFYVRGDGTRAYFFTKGEVHRMFCEAGLHEKQNLVDHRLQVNRKKQVVMHRVWVQGKFQKPLHWTQRG
ncbi:tRNA N(3)-methylcytidine methyltransferase METTL8, mitochondrial isoform X5 [Peromyscus californicus insignis]|uniref:tRNA N(3)-methylcytidine methyltransferase METTL8, mitochondrial isoform X5 n=1 Tax=Peromyscus californicus insignis TaxID=564181 RepID=UPI0022A777F4|nr:tRNA N(3)-methylcytidine methyltransferase METTL8, mitochondrial isoform X5 [Peromyscus californicus insignis]